MTIFYSYRGPWSCVYCHELLVKALVASAKTLNQTRLPHLSITNINLDHKLLSILSKYFSLLLERSVCRCLTVN